LSLVKTDLNVPYHRAISFDNRNVTTEDPNISASSPIPTGHPRGLYTLFFTEMWERFSYYGMRALLILFMAESVKNGGMGFSEQMAGAIYGLYVGGVYLAALPGGWAADRLLGAQRSVFVGGCLIALGHFSLAIPGIWSFYLGLLLVVLGTGLLKPNVSAIVGGLYPEGGARRDAGFTIYYMGINLGAAIGPLVCGWLASKNGWHYGFAAAGAGMVLGLVQYQLTRKPLGEAGRLPGNTAPLSPLGRISLVAISIATVGILAACFGGLIKINPVALAERTTFVIVGIGVLYFVSIFMFARLNTAEKKRLGVLIALLIASAIFWGGFEQAGSSLNLFADRHTARMIRALNFEIPPAWFQSLNPLFILTLAPVIASAWVSLGRRQLNPTVPVKFAMGLLMLAAGFGVMALAAVFVAKGEKVGPLWLTLTYLLHTTGELCLSPVGLSSVTKLAPARLTGQLMGTWFLATSLGNLIAGLAAVGLSPDKLDQMPMFFLKITFMPVIAGALLFLLARRLRTWTSGAE
jgi:POT family proton-dependent oligopeptide transporter